MNFFADFPIARNSEDQNPLMVSVRPKYIQAVVPYPEREDACFLVMNGEPQLCLMPKDEVLSILNAIMSNGPVPIVNGVQQGAGSD